MENLVAKTVQERYAKARTKVNLKNLVNNICELEESKALNSVEAKRLSSLINELTANGKEAVYEYCITRAKRLVNIEKDVDEINCVLNFLFDKVIMLNDGEKLWKYINLLQDFKEEYGYKFNVKKCAMEIFKTDNVKLNLAWCELYEENTMNKMLVLNGNDLNSIISLIRCGRNIDEEDIEIATELVIKYSDDKQFKEFNEILAEKYSKN